MINGQLVANDVKLKNNTVSKVSANLTILGGTINTKFIS